MSPAPVFAVAVPRNSGIVLAGMFHQSGIIPCPAYVKRQHGMCLEVAQPPHRSMNLTASAVARCTATPARGARRFVF